MNGTFISKKSPGKPAEDYSDVIFTRVFYDNNLPIMHLMSATEALRQRRRDMLEIMLLTEKAKRTIEQIEKKA